MDRIFMNVAPTNASKHWKIQSQIVHKTSVFSL